MRYLEAGTLKDRLSRGPLPLSEVNRIIGQVGSALDYAHRMGVVHRDVKPTNVLLDAEGNTFLTDFGLARMMEASIQLTETGVGIGTPAYMSPEQGKGAQVDARSDIYSLGVMLYEMVIGRAPYKAETPLAVVLKHIQEPLPLPRSLRPDLTEKVEHVILRAMAKDPDDRFQTAREMVRALDMAVREAEAPTRTEPVATSPKPAVAEVAEIYTGDPIDRGREALPAGWGRLAAWGAVGLLAMLALFLTLNRAPPGGIPTPGPDGMPPLASKLPAGPSQSASSSGGRSVFWNDETTSPQLCVDYERADQVICITEDLAFEETGGASWSPGGRQILFSARVGEGEQKLYVTDADGANLRQLTSGPGYDGQAEWSPDGRWIAFYRDCDLWRIHPDGSGEEALVVSGDYCVEAPTWSPDSRRIAFLYFPNGVAQGVWVVNADGSDPREIYAFRDEQPRSGGIVWSPDGEQIVCRYWVADDENEEEQYVLFHADGRGEAKSIERVPDEWQADYWPRWGWDLTITSPINPTDRRGKLEICGEDLCVLTPDEQAVPLGLAGSYVGFNWYTWSPDGAQIAFSACPAYTQFDLCEELYVADLRSGAVVRLPRQPINHHPLAPAWSPDDEWIAFHDAGHLSVIRPDGTGYRRIVQEPDYCPSYITWSPDSSRLAWLALRCDQNKTSPTFLLTVNVDGRDVRLLWTRDIPGEGRGADKIAFSPDGGHLVVRFNDGLVFRVDPDCEPGPEGCDASSRGELETFPEQWLHSYWPRWGGGE